MSFGVVAEGFNIKRLPDIIEEMDEQLTEAFGKKDTSAESVLGQVTRTFANQAADVWEQMGKVYNSASPALAEGVALDQNVILNGITRLESLPSVANVGMKGTEGTVVTAGKQVRNNQTNELFEIRSDTTITKADQLRIYFKVNVVADGEHYVIAVDGWNYDIISGGGSTEDSIIQQLVDEILLHVDRAVEPTNLTNGVIMLVAKTNSFSSATTTNLDFYTVGIFQSINKGEILALENTLTIIETPVSGWTDASNFEDGIKGRGIEEDPELRVRRDNSLQIAGGGTLEAIIARILEEVEGVVAVSGYENRTDVPDGEGRPPHSVEIIVTGGSDQDIANKLWQVKGGGIETFGNTSEDVLDSNGDLQTMNFSRPVDVDIWVKATLTLNTEEIFPTDGEDQVKQQILDYGDSLGIGDDVIPQRFHGPIFEVPGIETILIELADATPPPYQTTKIPIDDSEHSSFALARIDVVIL